MRKFEEWFFEHPLLGIMALVITTIGISLSIARGLDVGSYELAGKIVAKHSLPLSQGLTLSLTTEGESITRTISSFCKLPKTKIGQKVNIYLEVPLFGCTKITIKEKN